MTTPSQRHIEEALRHLDHYKRKKEIVDVLKSHMNTENQSWPPDGAALTYPRDIFVLGLFDHGNSRGESPSLPFSGGAGQPECTAAGSAAGHCRFCKYAGPRCLIRPTAPSVSGIKSTRQQAADKRRKFALTLKKKLTNKQKIPEVAPICSSQVFFSPPGQFTLT